MLTLTLMELAKRYLADVEQRIECLRSELTGEAEFDEDIEDQIGHWRVTADQIKKTIKENGGVA